MSESNVPQKRETTKGDLRSLITSDKYKEQFAMALPQFLTPERFTRVTLTALTKTPKLMQCTPESVMSCLLDCASLGIEPDGRRAHLIPFNDNKRGTTVCTLIIDYKGYIELARRSGELAIWRAELVCENDQFEYNKGEVTKHIINWREPRGNPYAVYSYVRFKDGAEDYEVMTRSEVEGIRARSRAGKAGPWVTDWEEMAKKTVIRRHGKRLPLSAEFRDAMDKDADTVIDIEKAGYHVHEGKTRTEQIAERLTGQHTPDAIEERRAEGQAEHARNQEPGPEAGGAQEPEAPDSDGKFALCAECDGDLHAYSDGDGGEAAYVCSKCGLLYNAQGEVCGQSNGIEEPPEAAKPVKQTKVEPQGERRVEPVCPGCGGELTTQGAMVGYLRCKCGVMLPEKGGAK